MKFISVPVFIISLTIGLFLAYITAPNPGVIYVYPNPDNIDKIQFIKIYTFESISKVRNNSNRDLFREKK